MKYAYTLERNVIHIDEAEKQIDYICADCESILHVKHGDIKKKHFFSLEC